MKISKYLLNIIYWFFWVVLCSAGIRFVAILVKQKQIDKYLAPDSDTFPALVLGFAVGTIIFVWKKSDTEDLNS